MTARTRGRAAGSTTSIRATACRSSWSRSTPSAWPSAADVALVSYPHGAAAEVVAALRERGPARRRPVGRLPARATRRCTSAGTGRTARPTLLGEAVFGLTELHRDEIAARDAGRQPRLLLDRRDPGARAARARGADRGRGRRRQERRVRRRPRGDRHARTSSRWTRTSTPYARRRAPPRARDRPGAGCARLRRARHLHAAPAAARPGPARELLRDADARRSTPTSWRRCSRTPTAASRSSSWPPSRPGVRDVRDTNLCRIHATALAGRARARVRRDRQPLEGRRRPGGAEPERDARRSTRRRACGERPERRAFFRSRWVDAPAGVAELDPGALPARLPRGRGRLRDQALAAAATSGVARLRRRRRHLGRAVHAQRARRGAVDGLARAPTSARLRAVVVNSGNANVGDGEQGLAVARGDGRRGRGRAWASSAARVGVASTGVIGVAARRGRRARRRSSARPAELSPTAAEPLLGGDHDHRPLAQAREPRGAALGRARCGSARRRRARG